MIVTGCSVKPQTNMMANLWYLCLCAFAFFNQELSKPVAQACGSEEARSQNAKFDNDGNVQVTTATQWCTQHSDTDVEVGQSNCKATVLRTGKHAHVQ